MGFLDDLFDTKIADKNSTQLKYTPIKFNTKVKIDKAKKSPERESKLKECATWVYINSVEWCIALKGSHIHKKCMEEIFDNLEDRKGIPCSEYTMTLTPNWTDYWYDVKNHKHYTKQQLKRIEKEFDKGKDSENLVCEMLDYVWFNMLSKDQLYEEIDDLFIYKLRVKYLK